MSKKPENISDNYLFPMIFKLWSLKQQIF